MEKRGLSRILIIIIILAIALFIGFRIWHSYCTITGEEGSITLWFKENILACDKELSGFIGISIQKVGDFLGFDQTLYEFFWPDLPWGLLVGFWIFLSFLLIQWATIIGSKGLMASISPMSKKGEIAKLKSSWLFFIGSKFWKIIPIGILIAALLQVPILNTFIEAITFEFLGTGWFIESILLAFYIGLLPGALEAYSRYRMRMHYYKQITRVKYGIKIIKSTTK